MDQISLLNGKEDKFGGNVVNLITMELMTVEDFDANVSIKAWKDHFGVEIPAITIAFALSSLVSLSLSVYISWKILGGHVNPAVIHSNSKYHWLMVMSALVMMLCLQFKMLLNMQRCFGWLCYCPCDDENRTMVFLCCHRR
ncbi:hypothetical protein ISN44_As08g011440 [Arabidopsis suecica]|uniref:Uncharacterized protein n=1 Tax=Arabidopsis suecica TaxID=45249 RepID=A0A8T2B8E8_ARASU|nr:hypothetical protein ISN44_As08g011440 [Arabidopsis suecica]